MDEVNQKFITEAFQRYGEAAISKRRDLQIAGERVGLGTHVFEVEPGFFNNAYRQGIREPMIAGLRIVPALA